MKELNRKCLLAAVVLLCMAPASFASKPYKDKDGKCRPGVNCQQVPEGGSAAIYLLGAGITCLGAMFVRSRSFNSSQS
jgi:hypothetical protein